MKLITPSFFILGLFVLGGMVFKTTTPLTCGPILPNDDVFVLTGDSRRIPFAMRQINQYPDTKLYIIGAGTPECIQSDHHITIESNSKSTYQNALAIKKIVNSKHLNRIVLVTTEEHMKRAKYLVSQELPNIEICTCPATLIGMPASRRLERWTIEYIKYIVTMFGIKEG